METDQKKKKITDFIKTQLLGVLSTVNPDGNPESALVAVAETKNLEIIFASLANTRKYRNLQTNKNVSFVIGFDPKAAISVQYEGVIRELDGSELEEAKNVHVAKDASWSKYAKIPENKYFKVKPVWIRYTDTNKATEEVFEISF